MGTPNNTTKEKRVVSSPPTLVEAIVGEFEFPENELSPEEMAELIGQVIQICKPHLKHLHGFAELDKCMAICGRRSMGTEYHWRDTPQALLDNLQWPADNINFQTLCLPIWTSYRYTIEKIEEKKDCYRESFLILSRRSELLRWTESFHLKQEHGHGHRSHRTATIEDVYQVTCELLTPGELAIWCSKHESLAWHLLKVLGQVMRKTYKRQSKQFFQTGLLYARMNDISKRLGDQFDPTETIY